MDKGVVMNQLKAKLNQIDRDYPSRSKRWVQLRRGAVREAHDHYKLTFDDIADCLGVSRARAHQIYRGWGASCNKPLPLSDDPLRRQIQLTKAYGYSRALSWLDGQDYKTPEDLVSPEFTPKYVKMCGPKAVRIVGEALAVLGHKIDLAAWSNAAVSRCPQCGHKL